MHHLSQWVRKHMLAFSDALFGAPFRPAARLAQASAAGLVLAVGVTTVALLVAPDIPSTVEQIRDAPEIALLCPLREVDVASW